MIDTHLHVWDRARSAYAWLDTAPEPLRGDHPLERALAAVSPFGFDRAILVQADDAIEETEYLLELAAAEERVAGAVCHLPLEDPDAVARLLPRLIEDPGFVGVRNLTHDRPDPDWILGREQRRSLALLEAASVPVDVIAVSPRHLSNLVNLALGHPGLTLVLDHLGKPPVGDDAGCRNWTDQLAEAAALPNVVAKVSGIYPIDPDASVTSEQMAEVLRTALTLFGPDRLMLGSDWPMCTVTGGGAAAVLRALISAVDALEPESAEALRTGTACRVYGLVR